MKIRKITSLTALLSFILVFVTSIILFLVPPGRIAYWTDWRFLGLNKTQWGDIHINLGILFTLSVLLHIYYNWKPIVTYLKNRQKELKLFTPEFNIAVAVTFITALGTFFTVPPFSSVLDFNTALKDAAAVKYGEPPFGHAELSPLKMLVKKTGGNLEEILVRLKKEGIEVSSPDQVFLDIARINRMTPKQLFAFIKPEKTFAAVVMPESPTPGTGNLTLAQFCEQYGLNTGFIIKGLEKEGVGVPRDAPLKSIAEKNNLNPFELYARIRALSVNPNRQQ